MIPVSVALLASAFWGASDFLGGIAARGSSVLRATVYAYLGANLVLVTASLFTSGTWSPAMMAAGTIAGVTNVLGLLAFYAAFANGPMGPMGAIVGATQAVVPVLVAVLWHGENLNMLAWAGVAVAVAGSVSIGLAEGSSGGRAALRPIVFAVLAGLFFGSTVVALGSSPRNAGLLTPTIEMLIGIFFLGGVILTVRTSARVGAGARSIGLTSDGHGRSRRIDAIAIIAGVVLGGANIAQILALQTGSLAAVGVVISLYPVTVAILARVFLKERLTLLHLIGIAAALGGCAMLGAQ